MLSQIDWVLSFKHPVGEVQMLADYIRVKACQMRGGGGWIIDGDSIWMRMPDIKLEDAESLGHFAGSMRKHPGTTYTKVEHARKWELDYLKRPQDELYFATPIAFPPGSKCLDRIVEDPRQCTV